MRRSWIYCVGFFLCCVFVWIIIKANNTSVDAPAESNYSIPRLVQYSFTLQNRSNRLLKKAEFWTHAPVKQTPTQKCCRIESSHPYRLILDDSGNQILHFTFEDLPPYATKIITVKADLLLSDRSNRAIMSHSQEFLKAVKYIESDDPYLVSVAQKLKASKPLKTAENIFQWVAGNLRYTGYLKNDRGALYALSHKKGDCSEFMYLFAALCRSDAIPVRCIGGYVCKESAVLKPGDYHNWAEFYANGTWRIADPQNKVFMKNNSDYIAMRIMKEFSDSPMLQFNRFHFKGVGLKVRMNL